MTARKPGRSLPPDLPGEGAFLLGTMLATLSAAGLPDDREIGTLKPGDALLSIAGAEEEPKPIRAIHRLEIDPASHATPLLVAPIRICAGAIAPGVPANDLFLPPEAMLRFRDSGPADAPIGPGEDAGHLVPAAALLNGTSITRHHVPGPHVWLVPDLGTHTILLAEGTALGSARLGAARGRRVPACIPVHLPGVALNAWRTRIAARAREAGLEAPSVAPARSRRTPLPELPHATSKNAAPLPPPVPAPAVPIDVVAAGATVPATERTAPFTFGYELPARTGPVRLRSAARHAPHAGEGRRFGVCIIDIAIDGAVIPFDSPAFGPGFHPVESNQEMSWRWTNGDAWLVLPYSANPRRLRIRITDWHAGLTLA